MIEEGTPLITILEDTLYQPFSFLSARRSEVDDKIETSTRLRVKVQTSMLSLIVIEQLKCVGSYLKEIKETSRKYSSSLNISMWVLRSLYINSVEESLDSVSLSNEQSLSQNIFRMYFILERSYPYHLHPYPWTWKAEAEAHLKHFQFLAFLSVATLDSFKLRCVETLSTRPQNQ